jgi:23S rRNA pseudouridine955/2504/2580 synthase
MSKVEQHTVSQDDSDTRLDRWFKRHYPDLGHVQLQKLLRTGQVRVDGKRAKASQRLEAGQVVRVPPLQDPAPDATGAVPARRLASGVDSREAEMIRSRVLYRDADIIVIDKPAGLATQGGTGVRVHVDGLLPALMFDAEIKPKLVHRLDRDTSGVLVLARTQQAAKALGGLFRGKGVRKIYWAITVGVPHPERGKISAALAKGVGRDGERMQVDEAHGEPARTIYAVLSNVSKTAAWLAMWPLTGRTHQLRVHAAEVLGKPILGDGKYGGEGAFLTGAEIPQQLHLHARRISFQHPRTGKRLTVEAPLPEHFRATFDYFGWRENDVEDDPFPEDP